MAHVRIDMIKTGNSSSLRGGGLCIGHLGHCTTSRATPFRGEIGRLDIVMVPIDGTYTMSLTADPNITRRLRASVVLPMPGFADAAG